MKKGLHVDEGRLRREPFEIGCCNAVTFLHNQLASLPKLEGLVCLRVGRTLQRTNSMLHAPAAKKKDNSLLHHCKDNNPAAAALLEDSQSTKTPKLSICHAS